MSRLAALLFLGLIPPAYPQNPAGYEPYRSENGLFECEAPKGAQPDVVRRDGVVSVRIPLDVTASLDIVFYPVPVLKRFSKEPAAYAHLAALLDKGGAAQTSILRPIEPVAYGSHPAWTLTRRYSTPLHGTDRTIDTQDTFLVIQRQADYVVISYQARPSLFLDRFEDYKHFVTTLKLGPELFWKTPKGLLVLAGLGVCAFLGLAGLLVVFIRRRGSDGEAPEEEQESI